MRSKIIIGSFVVFMFFLSSFTLPTTASSTATPNTPVAGDTLLYTINSWNVPSNLSVFLNGVVGISTNINLAGSKVAMKVLSVGPDGYLYGMYLMAGNGPISVTISHNNISSKILQNNMSSNFSSVLAPLLNNAGDLVLSIPANAASPVISADTALFNTSSSSDFFNPFWFKVSSWSTFESALTSEGNIVSDTATNATITVVGTKNTDGSQTNITLTYAKTSASDAVLTNLILNAKIMNYSTHSLQTVSAELDYTSTTNLALPSTFAVGNDLKYTFDTASLTITPHLDATTTTLVNAYISANSGNFSGTTTLADYLNYLDSQVNALQGKTASDIQINSINGTIYTATVTNYNSTPFTETINGFTGDSYTDPSSPMNTYTTVVPAVTPDFNMWQGETIGANAIGNIFVKLFSSSSASASLKANYTNLGLTNGPNHGCTAKWSQQSGYNLQQEAFHIDFTLNSTTINKAALNMSSSTFIPPFKVAFSADLSAGRAISTDGYVLSQGYKITATATLTSPDLTSPVSVNAYLNLKIKLVSGAPASVLSLANTANQNVNDITASPLASSPGFEFIPVFIGLVALPILAKKYKLRNK